MLATAVWRNVFKGDEEVDLRRLAEVVSYMRRVMKALNQAPDEALASGGVTFSDPGIERGVVNVRSKMLDVPIKEEELRTGEGPGKA